MAQFNVQVTDDKGTVVANETVEAETYVDACAEVVRQAAKAAGAPKPFILSGESKLDGPDVMS